MKKFLSLLGIISLTATTASSVVACEKQEESKKEDKKEDKKLAKN